MVTSMQVSSAKGTQPLGSLMDLAQVATERRKTETTPALCADCKCPLDVMDVSGDEDDPGLCPDCSTCPWDDPVPNVGREELPPVAVCEEVKRQRSAFAPVAVCEEAKRQRRSESPPESPPIDRASIKVRRRQPDLESSPDRTGFEKEWHTRPVDQPDRSDEVIGRTLATASSSTADARGEPSFPAPNRDGQVEQAWRAISFELPQFIDTGGLVVCCTRSSFAHIQCKRHLMTRGPMLNLFRSIKKSVTPIFLLNQSSRELMGMFVAVAEPTSCTDEHARMPCFKDATVQLHIERVRAMPVLSVADGDLPDFFNCFSTLKDMMAVPLDEDEVMVLLNSMAKKQQSILARSEFHQRGGGCGIVNMESSGQLRQTVRGAAVFFVGNSFCRSLYTDMTRLLADRPADEGDTLDTRLAELPEVRQAELDGGTTLKYHQSRECYSTALRDGFAAELEATLDKGSRPVFVVVCTGPSDLALPRSEFESKHRRLLTRLGPCVRHPNFFLVWVTSPPLNNGTAVLRKPGMPLSDDKISLGNAHAIKMADGALRPDGSNFVHVVDAWAECCRNQRTADDGRPAPWCPALHRQITRMVLTKIRQGLDSARLRKVARIISYLS